MSKRIRVILCLLAILLCSWPFIPGADPTAWMDRFAKGASVPVKTIICIIGLPLALLHGFSFMIGSGALGLVTWLRLRRLAPPRSALQPVVLPLLSAAIISLQALPFVSVPAGTSIRPMAWAACVLLGAFALTVASVTQSISALRRGGNRPICIAALLLSLSIIVIPSLSLNAVAKIKGFALAP